MNKKSSSMKKILQYKFKNIQNSLENDILKSMVILKIQTESDGDHAKLCGNDSFIPKWTFEFEIHSQMSFRFSDVWKGYIS